MGTRGCSSALKLLTCAVVWQAQYAQAQGMPMPEGYETQYAEGQYAEGQEHYQYAEGYEGQEQQYAEGYEGQEGCACPTPFYGRAQRLSIAPTGACQIRAAAVRRGPGGLRGSGANA